MSDGLLLMTDGIIKLTEGMLELVRSLPKTSEQDLQKKLSEIRLIEEDVDSAFDQSASLIMDLEVFPIDPGHFIQIARELDRMSDLIERTCLLLEWRRSLDDEESELLESAASQIRQLAEDTSTCVENLRKDKASVDRVCAVIVEREKEVDRIMGHYTRVSSRKGYEIEKRLWLAEVLGNLDTVADGARDLTITFRVITNKLDKQNRLDIKRGVLR